MRFEYLEAILVKVNTFHDLGLHMKYNKVVILQYDGSLFWRDWELYMYSNGGHAGYLCGDVK